jgi:hypothetical protein
MKQFLQVFFSAVFFSCFFAEVQSQVHTLYFQAVVNAANDNKNVFGGDIAVGDTISGILRYDLSATDGNASPEIADYRYNSGQYGFFLNVESYKFESDTSNLNFLVELTNTQGTYITDNFTVNSYNNIMSPKLFDYDEIVVSWQIEDTSKTALSNTDLPRMIDLGDWQQITALTFRGENSGGDTSFFYRAQVIWIDTFNLVASVREHAFNEQILAVYPNPIKDYVKIEIEGSLRNDNLTFSMYTSLGALVTESSITSTSTKVHLGELSSGLYTYLIRSSKGDVQIGKILVE